jgi:hypothetical protein
VLAAHLAGCAACRERCLAMRAMIQLARELPVALPSASHREEVRTAVLAAAARMSDRPARRSWLAPALLVAAAGLALAMFASLREPAPPAIAHHSHGVVRPHAGARYVTTVVGADEIVRLVEGVIDVEVEPLLPGERFRVVIGDAELEVRGTAFTVSAADEHLVDVAVAHGRVDVRPRTGAPATLGKGQSWRTRLASSSPASTPELASGIAPRTPSPQTPASSLPPSVTSQGSRGVRAPSSRPRAANLAPASSAPHGEPSISQASAAMTDGPAAAPAPSVDAPPRAAEEQAYDQAWEALRANDFARAASGFARVQLLTPNGPLVEDAAYWRAVALARGQRSAEAISAFRDVVDAHPRSARTGEASAMLGWLLIDQRAFDEAARRFTAAARDGNPVVRNSAQAGLDALRRGER